MKGGSHDSILMLFQNHQPEYQKEVVPISSRTTSIETRMRKLPAVLPCQSLVDVHEGISVALFLLIMFRPCKA